MIVGGESMNRIYISSRNQNQFFEKREMLLGQKPDEKFLWFLGLGDHQTKEKPWRIYLLFMKCWFISLLFAPKKPGFPLEVANGEMEKSLGPILENSLCLGCLLFVQKKANSMVPNLLLTLDWGSYWSDGRPKRTMVFLCQEGWFLCHIGEERFTNSSPVIGMRRCCNQTPSFGEWFRGSGWGLCCSFFRLGCLSFFLECLL